MGRRGFASYSQSWSPPHYTVDDSAKVVNGYTPPGLSNWGRWGEDDERGTANLISPEMIVAAAALVRRGAVFSLALPIDDTTPRSPSRPPVKHYFLMSGSDGIAGNPYNEGSPGFVFNDDAIDVPLQGSTQWDGLAHAVAEDSLYNGFWAGNVTASGGAARMGIDALRDKFVGRGVLLDFARAAGVSWLPPGTPIGPTELDAACDAQGVSVGCGDILLLRTGYLSHWWRLRSDGERSAFLAAGEAGLSFSAVDWLAERDIAAVAADNLGLEVLPSENGVPRRLPVHQTLLVDLGLTIGELWELDELAADCAQDGVYEFLVAAPPLNLPRAVGSLINPLAIK
jgi:kynurenine formamidase